MRIATLTLPALAAVAAASLIAACGQKGPLTLPEKTTDAVVTRPTQTPSQGSGQPEPANDTGKKKSEPDKQP
jgi:predicted small lipoprotein YifL